MPSTAKSFTLYIGKVRPRERKGLSQGPTAACVKSWDQITHLWTRVAPKDHTPRVFVSTPVQVEDT